MVKTIQFLCTANLTLISLHTLCIFYNCPPKFCHFYEWGPLIYGNGNPGVLLKDIVVQLVEKILFKQGRSNTDTLISTFSKYHGT